MNSGRLMLKGPPPSEQEAATRVQAQWRGLMVRRTRPLEKLLVIYQVRQDLRAHLQVLAGSAQFEKLCSDPNERLRWSECAMALLLRLDSVQGAHADVREVRKIVTKEVIALQEIVDSTSKDASSGTKMISLICDQKGPEINALHISLAWPCTKIGFTSETILSGANDTISSHLTQTLRRDGQSNLYKLLLEISDTISTDGHTKKLNKTSCCRNVEKFSEPQIFKKSAS